MSDLPPYVAPAALAGFATTLLAACGQALDDNGITDYPQRIVFPGKEIPVDVPGLLGVVQTTVHPGRIGTQQFAGLEVGAARWKQNVCVFRVELWTPMPAMKATSVSGFTPPTATATTNTATALMTAGWVIYSALVQEQFSNELFPFKPALVGPLDPLGPEGSMVGEGLSVQIQLP